MISNFFLNSSMPEIDSESEEFEDAEGFDDDIFTDTTPNTRIRPKNLSESSLIFLFRQKIQYFSLVTVPDKIDDETVGCVEFIQNYEERYGSEHPCFFQGSLDEAVKEACHKPARDVNNFLPFFKRKIT